MVSSEKSIDRFAQFFRSQDQPVDPSQLSMSDFQKAGLLRELTLYFRAKPSLVHEATVSHHFKDRETHIDCSVPSTQPLLNSQEFYENIQLKKIYEQRLAELQVTYNHTQKQFPFESRMSRAEQNEYAELIIKNRNDFRMYGKSRAGKRRNKYAQGMRRHNRNLFKNEGQFLKERNAAYDTALLEDARDVITSFVTVGSETLSLLPDARSAYLATLVSGSSGRAGTHLINVNEPDSTSLLFESFTDLLVDYDRLKGVGKTSYDKKFQEKQDRKTGRFYIPAAFRSQTTNYLLRELKEEDWYVTKFKSTEQEKAHRFFFHWNIVPLEGRINDSLSTLEPSSLDTIIIDHRVRKLPEKERELTLHMLDLLLKPEGHLIFREGPTEQAAVEYYGEKIFSQGYTRLSMQNLYLPNHWMIYQKEGENHV